MTPNSITRHDDLRLWIIAGLLATAVLLIVGPHMAQKGVTGAATAGTRLIAAQFFNATCEFHLEQDWNLISVPCITDNRSPESVFTDILSDVISIHEYTPDTPPDSWKVYNPSIPSAISDLTIVNDTKGYWINMAAARDFNVSGLLMIPNWLDVGQGYNLIGYPSNESQNLTKALITADGRYTVVHLYNASDMLDHWKSYNPWINASFNDLTVMVPSHGYWINMTGPTKIILGLY